LNSQAIESAATVGQACWICGAFGPHALYIAREMMFGFRDPFEYFECNSCACLQIREFPLDISRYYPANYYAHSDPPTKIFAYPILGMLLKARARYVIFGRGLMGILSRGLIGRAASAALSLDPPEWSLRALRPSRESSILDVGCGTGLFLYVLREIGFQNLLGVDPFIAGDCTYKNGLRLEKRSLADVSGAWDIIMFHHSFEHIDRPLETLRHVRRLLKPSGHCVIRIPVASSYAWRHYRTDWVQLDAPRHYFLHSRASIEHLAGSSDLRLTSVRCDSTELQFWGSELYRRDIRLLDGPKQFGKSDMRKFRSRAKQLNASGDGDAAAFYLTPAE
jgi:SAM-dependent methyltransferase